MLIDQNHSTADPLQQPNQLPRVGLGLAHDAAEQTSDVQLEQWEA